MKIETLTGHAPVDYRMFVGGAWVDAVAGGHFARESPGHDVVIGTYPEASAADVDAAVTAARAAFDRGPWPSTGGAERSTLLLRVAAALRARADELGRVEALESGKPIAQARDEIGWTAALWEYAAALARNLHGDSHNTLGTDKLAFVLREPIGVVGMITPWNFPLLIVSQKLPFALAAGCTAVIKPSELTPGTTLMLAGILADAGLPLGVVNVVTGYGDPVGSRLAAHPDVDMVSFTGSTRVGRHIVAASAGNLKKVSLELGGKNPQVVFPDADLGAALDAALFGVYFNAGECCNAGSRLLVHESIADAFTDRLVERARSVRIGDPLDEQTKVGAIINGAQFDKIMSHLKSGREQGARLRVGGDRLRSERGRYIQATVFDRVTPEMEIAREEIFGPVLSVLRFDTLDDAIRIANDTLYGLSAAVWTRDVDTAFSFSRAVRAGTVWINCFMDGYPELPFGGFKQSGLGRELGRLSVEEFTEAKTVQLHLGPRTHWWHTAPTT